MQPKITHQKKAARRKEGVSGIPSSFALLFADSGNVQEHVSVRVPFYPVQYWVNLLLECCKRMETSFPLPGMTARSGQIPGLALSSQQIPNRHRWRRFRPNGLVAKTCRPVGDCGCPEEQSTRSVFWARTISRAAAARTGV